MGSLAELQPHDAAEQLIAEHDMEWLTAFSTELDRRLSSSQLQRWMSTWVLSRSELGRIFGVSRQAVSKWLTDGAPSDRAPAIANIAAICDLLEHYVKRERIPAVVRRQSDRLAGRSLLDMIAAGEHAEALTKTRQMFTFGDLHS